jgi:thiamine-phosphate pyrophosphorylase
MLKEASDKGIIDEKVVALGGVTFDKIPYLNELNFGGAAMMGSLVGSFLL